MKIIIIILILLLCVISIFWASDDLTIPQNPNIGYVLGNGYRYEITDYIEKDGCIYFDSYKICGNYTLYLYKK